MKLEAALCQAIKSCFPLKTITGLLQWLECCIKGPVVACCSHWGELVESLETLSHPGAHLHHCLFSQLLAKVESLCHSGRHLKNRSLKLDLDSVALLCRWMFVYTYMCFYLYVCTIWEGEWSLEAMQNFRSLKLVCRTSLSREVLLKRTVLTCKSFVLHPQRCFWERLLPGGSKWMWA